MDFLLWIISWFEFPIFGILFFIGIPVCIVFAIMYFTNTNQKIKDEKKEYEEFKAWKKNRERSRENNSINK